VLLLGTNPPVEGDGPRPEAEDDGINPGAGE